MADEEKKQEEKSAQEEVSAADFAAYANILIQDETDYEARFMKDAFQRAHDRELAALANLALIRSERDERRMLLAKLEVEQAMSPREVRRRLRAEEDQGKPEGG